MQNISFRLQPTVHVFKNSFSPVKNPAFKGVSASPVSDTFERSKDYTLHNLCKNTKELCKQNIKPENHINGGNHSDVYKIDGTELYVLKIEKENSDFDKPLKIIPDEFDGKNFGQEIAVNNAGIAILKKSKVNPCMAAAGLIQNGTKSMRIQPNTILKTLKKSQALMTKHLTIMFHRQFI